MHDSPIASPAPHPVPQVLQQMNGLGNLSERVTEAACELERRLNIILRPEITEESLTKCSTDSRDGQVLLAASLVEHNATLHRALVKLESILSRIEV